MQDKDFLLALCQSHIIGPSRLKRLWAYFNTWQKTWQASEQELIQAGLSPSESTELWLFKQSFNITEYQETLEKNNIKTITTTEPLYPKLLQHIYAPPLLYYQGDLSIFNQPSIAVVGSRLSSYYGQQVVEKIVGELAHAGFLIISGLALGIDTLAHNVTLKVKGKTVAVLGSGLKNIYPRSNYNLAKEISAEGCLLSEFSPTSPPLKGNFPRRNRLIAGLAQATLVIEASEKSGALITARWALAENREVMAVPGSIFSPYSQGTNNLIKLGAFPVTSAADIFSILEIEQPLPLIESLSSPEGTDNEKEILKFLSYEPLHINQLAKNTKLDIKIINSRLTIMELNGLVKNVGNMHYIRIDHTKTK
jgi:DNA processing protein